MLGEQLFYVLDFGQTLRGCLCLQDLKSPADVFHELRVGIEVFARYSNNLAIRSYYLPNLTAASVFVRLEGPEVEKVVFPAVPVAFNPPRRHRVFIYTNLYLEYSL